MRFVLFMIACSWFLTGCGSEKKGVEGEDFTIETRVHGYRGEALRNPYMVAQKFIESEGYDTKVSSRVRFDVSEYDVVVIPASVLQSKAQINMIERFISDGGHLICMLANGEKNYKDFNEFHWFDETINEDVIGELLSRYALELDTFTDDRSDDKFAEDLYSEVKRFYEVPSAEDLEVNMYDQKLRVRIGGTEGIRDLDRPGDLDDATGYYFTNDEDLVISDGADLCKILSKGSGFNDGRLTVISDGRLFRNPHLATQDHPTMLLSLLEASNAGAVLFSSGKTPSFYDLVWKNFPYVLIGISFAIVLWLLSKHQRFGPVLEAVVQQPLNYLKSIDASGHFLWKHRREGFLLSALQNKASQISRLKNLSGAEREEHLRTISELVDSSPQEISIALGSGAYSDPPQFIKTVQLLQKIIQRYE